MNRLTDKNYRYSDIEFMDSGMAESFNKLAEYEDAEEKGFIRRCGDCGSLNTKCIEVTPRGPTYKCDGCNRTFYVRRLGQNIKKEN